jgi:hypothetical protein
MHFDFIQRAKFFLKDKYIFWAIIVGIVLWAISFGMAYVQIFPLEKNLILHFNFHHEVDAIGSTDDVIWIVMGLAILFTLDQILASFLYFREKIVSYVVSYSGVLLVFLGLFVIYYLTLAN